MPFLNSAPIGLLGALKDKGLNASKYKYLKNLDYKDIVDFLLSDYILQEYRDRVENNLESLEFFLRLTYLKTTSKFLRFTKGPEHEFLKIFLREYDIYNLKIIIRAIILGGERSEQIYQFPFSIFYKNLPPFNTVNEILNFLRKEKEFRDIVDAGLQEYKKRQEYFYFEVKMDKLWLQLLKSYSQQLGNEVYSKVQRWLAVIYILWALRLIHIHNRDKQEVLAQLDLSNQYLNKKLVNSILNASDLKEALEVVSIHFDVPEMEFNWETTINDLFFNREIESKFGFGVFSFFPIFRFVFQQRYYTENIIYLLNEKIAENV